MSCILDKIKQLLVSNALKIIRLLIRVKPAVVSFIGSILSPLSGLRRFFVAIFLVPGYKLFYLIRKQTEGAYRPAKNKFMLLVTNRYTIHVIVIGVVIFVGVLNLQTDEVRAETFGQKSLMYALVAQQDSLLIEEYAREDIGREFIAVKYQEPLALSARVRGIDFIGGQSITSLTNGGALTALTVSDSAASLALREGVEEYVIQPGDTLSNIAEQFNISLNTLLWSNNLSVRSVLKLGNTLEILPVSGVRHVVKSGDTLSRIANKYDVESAEIIEFNKLASANDLVVGEALLIPGGQVAAPAPVRRTATISQVLTTPSIPTRTSTASPTTAGSGVMIWPTDLRTITQYYGWRHTGLDIDCKFVNDNYAADDGVVQYSGWKGGYGYTVEINHGNGIVTRYGHHASLYVSAGQQVVKGQAIGRCGTTGRSTGTHIHFEVIVNGRFRNPLEYIR